MYCIILYFVLGFREIMQEVQSEKTFFCGLIQKLQIKIPSQWAQISTQIQGTIYIFLQ